MTPPRQPPKIPRPAPAPVRRSPAVEALGRRLESAGARETREAVSAEFWHRTAARTPLVETGANGERILTFLWRSPDAAAVLLFVNRLTDETDLGRSELDRVPGTDIWHLSYALEANWRGSYGFIVHDGAGAPPWRRTDDQVSLRALLDRASFDPRNPVSCPNRAGTTLSVAELPEAPPQPWRDIAAPTSGETAAGPDALRRAVGPDGRECWLYEPPTEAPGGVVSASAPLWLILDGEVWIERFAFHHTLDAMIAAGELPPLRAVFIHSGGVPLRWASLEQESGLVDTLADGYLPWARRAFSVETPAARCGIAGQSLGGIVSLRAGALRPDAFGAVLSQSASLWLEPPTTDRLIGAAASAPRFRVEVGTHEWVLHEPNRAFHLRLREAGVDAELVEYSGGHDYACWRGGLADGVAALSRGMLEAPAQPAR